jgi:hypothetical protein
VLQKTALNFERCLAALKQVASILNDGVEAS